MAVAPGTEISRLARRMPGSSSSPGPPVVFKRLDGGGLRLRELGDFRCGECEWHGRRVHDSAARMHARQHHGGRPTVVEWTVPREPAATPQKRRGRPPLPVTAERLEQAQALNRERQRRYYQRKKVSREGRVQMGRSSAA